MTNTTKKATYNPTYRKLRQEVKDIEECPISVLFLDDIYRFYNKNDKALENGLITQKQHDRMENMVHDIWLAKHGIKRERGIVNE